MNLCYISSTFYYYFLTKQTFQRYFNVAFWLMRRIDVGQRQIDIEATLCISTLEFTTSNNVESTLTWTTLDNVVIFNLEHYNVGKHRKKVVEMTVSKKNKKYYFK